MTLLGLMRMTILAQGATNSVAQFVKIVLKILAQHLRNRAKPFPDDVRVKGPKPRTTMRNLLPEFDDMLSDKVLADLEHNSRSQISVLPNWY